MTAAAFDPQAGYVVTASTAFISFNDQTFATFYQPILGPAIAGMIGLIPNCAASVILTQMYLENVISLATVIAGLLVGAGVGLAVLFKMNKGIKQNFKIVTLLYGIGVIAGIVIELIGVHI